MTRASTRRSRRRPCRHRPWLGRRRPCRRRRRRRPDPTAPDYGCFMKELHVVRLVEFQGSFSRLKSTTLITKAKRIPLSST